MTIILSDTKCPSCGERLIKKPDCGGDYHNTVAGYVLQQYCNNVNCKLHGILRPMIEGKDPDFISNREKDVIAVKVAEINKLGFQETKKLARSCDTNSKDEFIVSFAKAVQIPLLDIMNFSG